MKIWHVAFIALAAAGLSGCVESAALLSVNKDGSGTVEVQECFSPQLMQMMEGMTQAMGEGDADPLAMFADAIAKKQAQLGEGAQLVSKAARTNRNGWKGYKAIFSFQDINKVTIMLGDSQGGDEEGGEMSMGGGDTGARFAFTPGDVCELTILPLDKGAEEPALVAEGETSTPGEGEMPGEGDLVVEAGGDAMGGMDQAAMTAMMAPMLKGMRLSLFIKVDGEIVETNARNVRKPNIITVMDVQMDKLLANPEAAKLLGNEGPETNKKLIELNIPGVVLEEEGKTLTVKFK